MLLDYGGVKLDLVVIHNDFNNVSLKALKEKELDILMSVCYKLRDEGTKEVQLSFSELKELSQYHNKNLERFIKDVEGVFNKFLKLRFRYEDDKKIVNFVLFTRSEIQKDDRYVSIKVNEEYKYILNELTGNYTKFELNQFVKLNSQYSKNLFRLLKQFSSTGWREFLLSDFRDLLDIPEKYRISEIDKYVLNEKIIGELNENFKNLKVIKLKNGRLVYKIRFEWDKIEVEVLPKTTKEKMAKQVLKQVEKDENNKIDLNNKKVVTQEEFEKLYKIYLNENDGIDNSTTRKFFSKRFEILVNNQEKIENSLDNENSFFLTKEEKKLIKDYRKLQEKSKIMTYEERFDKFYIHDLMDTKYPRLIGYEEYFTDKDLCNELTEEGLKFVENYIKENKLENSILSKNKKELRGLAKTNKMIKVFKMHYEENVYIPKH